MRVVQLLPELEEGGVERGVVELNRELARRGVESLVISSGGKLVKHIAADGGRHIPFDLGSKNPLTAWARAGRLRRLIAELQPDLLHARSRVPAWLAWLANRELDLPFVTTVHGFNSVNAYSRVMTSGEKVICVSGAIRDYVRDHYRVPDENLVVIPRGVDLEAFDPGRLDREFMATFQQRFDLADRFVVTAVGRITRLKDYETFITALVELQRQIPRVAGLIVGGVREDKRSYFASLRQQVAAAGAAEFIHFAGSQSKVAEIYALSDVVVNASRKPESFGRSAAEALAMNTPVVASAHGGILDIVIPGRSGRLFPPGDPAALAKALLACRQERYPGLRDFVRERFTLEGMVESTLGVYRQVLGRSATAPRPAREDLHG